MGEVFHLVNWKMRLTWRIYTRHTLASIESLLFFLIFIVWLVLSACLMAFIAKKGFDWVIPALVYCDLYSVIFLMWLIVPLAGYRTNESYDLNRLKVYPLPAWKIFLANLLGAFTDISVLLPLSGFIAIICATQLTLAEIPVVLLLILALFFLLITTGVTIVNALYVLLPRLNLVAVMVVIAGGVLIWVSLINLGVIPHPAQTMNFFVFFRPEGVEFFRAYPPGQIAIALDAFLNGQFDEMTDPLLGFAGWTAGVLVLNYLLVAYFWESDPISINIGRRTRGPDIVTIGLNRLEDALAPFFGHDAMAVFKKDMLEFATRSPYFFLYKILPGSIAPMIILIAMRWNLTNVTFALPKPEFESTLLLITFGTVIFIVVGQGILFAGNQFGFEGDTIRSLLTFPTPRKSILLGKNLFLGGLFLLDSVVLSLLVLLYYPTAYAFCAWLTLMVTLFLLILSIGNYTSSFWPYWMPLDKPSFSMRSTVILSFVNIGFILVLATAIAPAGAIVVVPHLFGLDWLSFLMMPLAIYYGILFHRITMGHAVNLLESNEFLVLRRIADREEM